MSVILAPAEHAEVLRQIALWPVCPTTFWKQPCTNPDCVKGRIPGPIYLTVEGDPVEIWHYPITDESVPTHEFVAPSRFVEATGPCETCGGRPWNLRTICCSFLDDASTWRATWDEVEAIRRSYVDPPMEGHERVGIVSHCSDCIDGRKRAELRVTAMVWDGDLQRSVPERYGGSVLFAHATIEVYDWTNVPPLGNPVLDPLPVPGRDWIVVLDGLVLA